MANGWTMKGHNPRRTGRAEVRGPRQAGRVWRCAVEGGVVINMEPAVTERGVYFGTWGLVRRIGREKTTWDKCDGKLYGLDPEKGTLLWPPLYPGITPYAYRYDGRKPNAQDLPAGPGLHWNFYNGTVEGTPAVDPADGTLYVGRGDGALYAVDPQRGAPRWTFQTLDPARPDDPEGGGEIVGGPLVAPGGLILFATFAAPVRHDPPRRWRWETNAVYAVERNGRMRWRYPRTGSADLPFVAPVALSPGGDRAYAVTGLPDTRGGCELLALRLASGELAWRLPLPDYGGQDLAVGADGTLFLGGYRMQGLRPVPVAFAVTDRGERGEIRWGPVAVDGARAAAHFAGGIALYEDGGRVRDLFVSTAVLRETNGTGGRLHRLDPASGRASATWNPEGASPRAEGGLTDMTLDDDGVLYVGVRGRQKGLLARGSSGRMFALRLVGGRFETLWSFEVAGQLDWASPALGPDGALYFGSSDALPPIALPIPRGPQERVPGTNPVFYSLRD